MRSSGTAGKVKKQLTNQIVPLAVDGHVVLQTCGGHRVAVLEAGGARRRCIRGAAIAAVLHARHVLSATFMQAKVDHFGDDGHGSGKRLVEGARGHERPPELHAQLVWHVPEGLQLGHVLRHAGHVLVVELVLRIQHLEHALVEDREEVVQHVGQLRVALVVVALQLAEEVREHLRVLHVDQPVGLLEHLVELLLRLVHHLAEDRVELARLLVQQRQCAVQCCLHERGELLHRFRGQLFFHGSAAGPFTTQRA